VEDVAALEDNEGCVGTAKGHLPAVVGIGDAALGSAEEECGATGGEEVLPVIAAEAFLRGDHFGRLESEGPAGRRLAKRVGEVEQ
jgi:hypothetical protein